MVFVIVGMIAGYGDDGDGVVAACMCWVFGDGDIATIGGCRCRRCRCCMRYYCLLLLLFVLLVGMLSLSLSLMLLS